MTRAADPAIRTKLLEGTVDYVLKRGLVDLTLRPLAAALDTSPRMLLYFFGSKERLITEALAQAATRQQQEFERLLSAGGSGAPAWPWPGRFGRRRRTGGFCRFSSRSLCLRCGTASGFRDSSSGW
jgi:AcrR family transcriptional regulator